MPTRANGEADIRLRIDKAVEAIRAMDLAALMPVYACSTSARRPRGRTGPSVAEPAAVSRYSIRANSRPLLALSAVTLPSVSTA